MKGRASTFGGRGFRWRTGTLQEDMGGMWSRGTCINEGMFLHSVTLADPGTIYDRINDPNEHLLLEFPNTEIFRHQFEQLVACYERLGIVVHQLPPSADHPNWIFQRDLFNATPWGVVLARPASQQRSGEEVSQQLELAKLRVPIVMMPTGPALFEGPDMLWVNAHTALVANNRRSTPSFFTQFRRQFPDVFLIEIPLPEHSQHLLGILNFLSPDHVAIWEDRFPAEKVSMLRDIGLRVTSLNCHSELQEQRALNWVCVGPDEVIFPDDAPETQASLNALGVRTHLASISEYRKCGGGMGCATGILHRSSEKFGADKNVR